MVHIEVVADTDPNLPADGPHLFVYRGLQRDARRKSLDDVDLIESSSPTSSRTSLTLRYEPQDVSSFVIVVGRRRPGRFVICVTASCETVSLTALPPAPAIVPVEGPGNEPSAPSTSYADAVKRCERDEAAFVDAAFPPGRAAIGGPDRFASAVRGWMRIGDVCDSPRLSADGVAFEDIQLHCRDLSFLVQALSALGVRAGRLVRRAFTPASSSASPWGVYSVRLHDYQRRHPVDVVVDDYIPVDDMHRPCFVRCCDPNLVWILLLVKAFAKMHGSYYALSTASRNDDAVPMAVYALTGEVPARVTLGLSDDDDDRVWPAVYDATHDGGVCVCCVPRRPWELAEQGIPLPWHQGYALVDTVQSGSVRLGVVRRTWGRHEPFEGRWALGSDAWNTSGDSKAFAADEIDPVSFFVDLTELRRMFSSVVLCPIPHDISGPFVYETMQTGVFHETLSEGTGRTGNPQFLFAARHGSVAISLRVPFVELRHRHRLSLTLCRVTSKTPLPLSKIAPGQVVACSAEPVPGRASNTNRDGARLEVTLPVRRSHRPILYVVIVGYGSSGAEAPFTITMQSTERTFLSRVAHVDQRACDDVLSRCLADPMIVPEPEKLATSAQQ
ncbi:hypothetical protein PBRA_007754 [Plasmodiophora brassicae]|nr:hypothetical protein PBRA_007754 [Plasmodiophora brassicae]